MGFHDIQMESITGEQIDFAQFKGCLLYTSDAADE